jgi:H+/Cl- antiporter ClcA
MADRLDADTARQSPERPRAPEPPVSRSDSAPTDPATVVRSRGYLVLLLIAAALGVPVAAVSYGFIVLINQAQGWLYRDLPGALGYAHPPAWWPAPLLVLAGLLVALVIARLPGRGGHTPIDGFSTGSFPQPRELPGVVLAALASLAAGAVIGPEAPLIALGGGLAALAVRLARRDPAPRVLTIVASAGSFAAISTLFGSPLLGAFLLMEAAGLSGATLGLVLVPGLLAAGIGTIIFVGLDAWTGLGAVSLSIPGLPPVGSPTLAEFGWAVLIGIAAAVLGTGIRRLGGRIRGPVERRLVLAVPAAGLVIAGLAAGYALLTGRDVSDVLFSGQDAIGPLLLSGAATPVAVVVLLLVAKGLGYCLSLVAFRGGPVFPAMFLGAAGGLALAHLPGLSPLAGAAMGIGAMSTVMLRLPLTSVLLATVLLAGNGLVVMPLVIVAVAVSYVVTLRLTPPVASTQTQTQTQTQTPSPSPSPEGTSP